MAAALALLALAILAGRGAGERGVLIEARDPAGGVDQIRVVVGGDVDAPHVFVMQPGDRIGDAVARAGGATAQGDLAPLNLARRVADEDSIRVPRRGVRAAALDLNTATGRQPEALPGIGPVRATIEVLSPPVATALPAHAERNDGSLVLLISVGERRILVAADIEAAGERWLIDNGQPLEADVHVVPHHGSASSSSPAFVEAVDPVVVAIISVGARNQFGHPATVILARYSEVRLLRTDEHGDVSLVTNGIELRVETDGE